MDLNEYIDYVSVFHANQQRKGGEAFVNHLYRVCDAVETERAKKIALIHDVFEDTHYHPTDLKWLGFEKDVIEGALILTKQTDETYFQYVQRIIDSEDRDVINVKVADTEDNLATVDLLLGADWMRKRYERSLKLLKEAT